MRDGSHRTPHSLRPCLPRNANPLLRAAGDETQANRAEGFDVVVTYRPRSPSFIFGYQSVNKL